MPLPNCKYVEKMVRHMNMLGRLGLNLSLYHHRRESAVLSAFYKIGNCYAFKLEPGKLWEVEGGGGV